MVHPNNLSGEGTEPTPVDDGSTLNDEPASVGNTEVGDTI